MAGCGFSKARRDGAADGKMGGLKLLPLTSGAIQPSQARGAGSGSQFEPPAHIGGGGELWDGSCHLVISACSAALLRLWAPAGAPTGPGCGADTASQRPARLPLAKTPSPSQWPGVHRVDASSCLTFGMAGGVQPKKAASSYGHAGYAGDYSLNQPRLVFFVVAAICYWYLSAGS